MSEGVIAVAFEFRQKFVHESGEVDEEAWSRYVGALARLFAESPEGAALKAQGVEPGRHLAMVLDYALRYVDANPAEMSARDLRKALDVFAEKVAGRPEDLDQVIPEVEAFCDFAQRAFDLARASAWKREVQNHADNFRRALRDPHHWGMAKSLLMEGLARGYDLSTEKGINEWMLTLQMEQLARVAEKSVPGGAWGLSRSGCARCSELLPLDLRSAKACPRSTHCSWIWAAGTRATGSNSNRRLAGGATGRRRKLEGSRARPYPARSTSSTPPGRPRAVMGSRAPVFRSYRPTST
ncbi:MAG TPA: hypothetical protein VNL16_05400 [Chloroflexota bacterium]|nr:hypothetical protein [Chloroflexota bacterium]